MDALKSTKLVHHHQDFVEQQIDADDLRWSSCPIVSHKRSYITDAVLSNSMRDEPPLYPLFGCQNGVVMMWLIRQHAC